MSHSVPTADSAPSPRLPGLSYALTADGLELPVIDIARLLASSLAAPAASVLALVSEGGLIDYGADAEVAAVLSEAAAIVPGDAVFVGTASRPDGGAGRMNGEGCIGIVLRGLDDVSRIAQDSGWLLGASLEEPLARSFVLEPRRRDAC